MSYPLLTETGPPIPSLIGSSETMERVYQLTRKVARSSASVLLLGETGTGKELVATAIHQLSMRRTGPFVKVNCGALSESLLESELFGHVRGAFTGAVDNRAGRFEAAHGGTIFLDEINSTTRHLQVKLLRVLQQREFERVGDTHTIRTDTRVIAASNCDLMEEVEANRFREDLYWRLNVVPIFIPPLRDRKEDVPELVSHFLQTYNEANDRYVVHIQREAMQTLQQYDWPGNVRELQNYIERAVVMADGDELTCDLLPEEVISQRPDPCQPAPSRLGDANVRSCRTGHLGGGAQRRQLAREDRESSGTRTDRPDHGGLQQRADESRDQTRHQSQHATQEAERIRPGEIDVGWDKRTIK